MAIFEEEYNRLNDEQKKAVDYIEGPLLVVAGPGTGKTQLLSARVANILKKTDAYPDNILCLTFTNKATDNMRARLIDTIGNDASRVAINTFHGIAAEIMNRNPQFFWSGAHLQIAPDALQLEIMQEVLSKLPPEHPQAIKFAGQFTLVSDTLDAINLAKEAGLTPNKLREIINSNLRYIDQIEPSLAELGNITVSSKSLETFVSTVRDLPEHILSSGSAPLLSLQELIADSFNEALRETDKQNKTAPISRWKSRWIQKVDGKPGLHDERRRNQWWQGVADAYEKYLSAMHSRGYYDFADMLVEVITQIDKHPELRATLQEQYQYVLIDEFQDTNSAQLRLAHLIADHQDLDSPNIMAVGDDDQSIFKFQGAELSNLLGFRRQYSDAKLIVLTQNYRSTQLVLDASETIIKHSRYRLVDKIPGLNKHLLSNIKSKDTLAVHEVYRSREESLSAVSNQALKRLRQGDKVAILARRHSSLRDIAGVMHANNVPIRYEQSNNILEISAIEQLLNISKTIVSIICGDSSMVNQLLSQTLPHPMWNIDNKLLWGFAIEQQNKYDWFNGLINSSNKNFNKIARWYKWLVGLSAQEPLSVIIEYILGLRDNDIMPSPINRYYLNIKALNEDKIETLSAIHTLRSLVTEFRPGTKVKIEDFVVFIELLQNSNKTISDNSLFVSGKNAVELLSVHKAKGLEFDSVFVVDAVNKEWTPRTRGRIPPANLPLRPPEDDLDDYTRLMYVSATRAKTKLTVCSYVTDIKGNDVLAASSLSKLTRVDIKPSSKAKLVKVLSDNLIWPRLTQTEESKLLKPLVEDFTMNVSNLINFLDVSKGGPQYFKERNLLRLPSAKSPSASLGNGVHGALEHAQILTDRGKFNLNEVIKTYDKILLNEGLPEKDYKRKLAEGRLVIKNLFTKLDWEQPQDARPEYTIAGIKLGDAKLSGKLDLVEITKQSVTVSDYKTGQALNSLALSSGEQGIKAWKHKLQLTFYALLIELDPSFSNKNALITRMLYVQADSKSRLGLEYVPDIKDTSRLKKLITSVWQHIHDLDFPDIIKYDVSRKGIEQFEEDLINSKI